MALRARSIASLHPTLPASFPHSLAYPVGVPTHTLLHTLSPSLLPPPPTLTHGRTHRRGCSTTSMSLTLSMYLPPVCHTTRSAGLSSNSRATAGPTAVLSGAAPSDPPSTNSNCILSKLLMLPLQSLLLLLLPLLLLLGCLLESSGAVVRSLLVPALPV